jgi:high-affinity iron transporter
VSHLVLGQEESRRWLKFLERRTRAAGQTSSPAWPLFLLAFIAAYREAVEIVLFFRSLILSSPGAWPAIAAGSVVGILALVLVVKGLDYFGKRLNPRPVMRISGLILTLLAVALVGQGVHALQLGGYVPLSPVRYVPSLSTLGLYPTWQTLLAQLATIVLIAAPFLPGLVKKAPSAPAAVPPSAT